MPFAAKVKDIWMVSLNDATGHEQTSDRPAIVLVINTQTNISMIIPLTKNLETSKFSYTYTIPMSKTNGLKMPSVALIYQTRTLDFTRYIEKMGEIEDVHLTKIKTLLKNYLGLT